MIGFARILCVLVGSVSLAVMLPGCDDTLSCPAGSCQSNARVTLPAGVVSGPYRLTVRGQVHDSEDVQSGDCNADGGGFGTEDEDFQVVCDLTGFEVLGFPAEHDSIKVQIRDAETDEVLVDQDVALELESEFAPNGPDCGPICQTRVATL